MSAFALSRDFADQQERGVHSHEVQVPDDYVVRKASRNVLDALTSEAQPWSIPDAVSSSARTLSNLFAEDASQTVHQIDAEKVVPPVDSRVLDKTMARRGRTLDPTAEWEGYVESITEDEFSVRMVNVRSKSPLPADQATFNKNDVSEYDRQLLKEGAIVRWVIGRERLPTGQVRNVSELYFRRLPAHSNKDYERASRKAETLLKAIIWEDEAKV